MLSLVAVLFVAACETSEILLEGCGAAAFTPLAPRAPLHVLPELVIQHTCNLRSASRSSCLAARSVQSSSSTHSKIGLMCRCPLGGITNSHTTGPRRSYNQQGTQPSDVPRSQIFGTSGADSRFVHAHTHVSNSCNLARETLMISSCLGLSNRGPNSAPFGFLFL